MIVDTADVIALRSPKPIGHVTCSEPEVYPVDGTRPSVAGHGLLGFRFTFTLSGCHARARFVAAFLRVRLDDVRVSAADLWFADSCTIRTSVAVPRPGVVSWLVGTPTGFDPIPDRTVVEAIFQAPTELSVLSGTINVDVTETAPVLASTRRRHGSSPAGRTFSLVLPTGWASVPRPTIGTAPPAPPPHAQHPAVRLCFAADIERFSRFTVSQGLRAQRRFVELLVSARAHAGLDEGTVIVQESGDGQFVMLPPGIDESVVLPRLVEGIRLATRETNADLNDHARLRLRVAFHRGHVHPAANGWAGDATIAVHRLLDADVLRQTLGDTPDADVAVIVPEVLYRDIVAHGHGTLTPDRFAPAEAVLPSKGFAAPAWIHVTS